MNRIAVLVVRDSSPIRFAGLDLADRAARVARRAGAETVQTVGDNQPFASAPPAELLLVLPERVVVEPGLLADLMRRSLVGLEDAAVVVDAEGKSTDILLLSRDAVKRIRFTRRVRLGLRQLAGEAVVGVVKPGARFCVRLRDACDVARVEVEYLRATNGGDGEGFFTRNIRWFSIPLSRRLVRLGATANVVTIGGFALAVGAGLSFAAGRYWAGIGGALLYWASMVLDCSDGEVARVTVRQSPTISRTSLYSAASSVETSAGKGSANTQYRPSSRLQPRPPSCYWLAICERASPQTIRVGSTTPLPRSCGAGIRYNDLPSGAGS